MEELSQKDQISVILIPSDTAAISEGAKSGIAAGLWAGGALGLGKGSCFFFRELH